MSSHTLLPAHVLLPFCKRKVAVGALAGTVNPEVRIQIPEQDKKVITAGGQGPAIWAKGHAVDRTRMTAERIAERLAGGDIPEPHSVVITGGGQGSAVWAEGHMKLIAKRIAERLTGGDIPQVHTAIGGG